MIILDAADVAPAPVALPWGEELALQLQRKFYIRWEQFRDLTLAIATCRHALDDGFLCVIVQEDASHVSIWKALSETVPVAPAPQVAAPPTAPAPTTYRGRPVAAAAQPQTHTTGAFSYRGRTVDAVTHTVSIQRPENIFYRGRAV